MSNITYHVTQPGGTPHGPYDLKMLKSMMARGQINRHTLYFRPGMTTWEPITDLIPCDFPISSGTSSESVTYVLPAAPNAKSRLAYILLAFFLGVWGVHNFFAGYTSKGIVQLLLTLCSCGFLSCIVFIWNIVEICTVTEDANGDAFS